MAVKVKCRNCGADLDAHADINGDHTPSDGDASICWHCGVLSAYQGDILIPLTKEHIDAYKKDGVWDQILTVQAEVKAHHIRHDSQNRQGA